MRISNYILTITLSLVFVVSCLLLPSALMNSNATSHQSNKTADEKTSTFGCEMLDDVLQCYPFRSEFEGNTTTYNSTKIMDITREPFYVEGKNGKAVEFIDRYREYVEIPQINPYNSSELTISFWVKETKGIKPHPDQQVQESPNAHIISNVNIGMNNGWFFDHNHNDQSAHFVVSDTSGGLTSSKSIPISNSSFTHIAATFDGSQIEVYRNGELFQTLSYDGNFTPASYLPIHLGSAAHCNSCNEFTGIIDDIKLYNRTISEDEIKQLYSSVESNSTANIRSNQDKGLIGHWPLNSTLDDLSTYKNKGKMFTLLSSMAAAPDDRIFISEKNTGEIKIMKDGVLLEKPFAVLKDHYVGWEQGLLGIALDPEFDDNHFVYLYYTSTNGKNSYPVNKVIRFTEKDNVAINSTVLLDKIPAGIGYHSGGALGFGPDGKLYITVGDATEEEYTQSHKSLLGKILRINKDGTIPSDNPFPDSPIYSLGHRNMFGLAFDYKEKIGIVTENGDELFDEINILKKGGNYGYPIYQLPNTSPELSNSSLDIKPIRSYLYPQGPTQALYYTGDKYPSLKNNFVFGTYTGDIYGFHLDNASKTIDSELRILLDNYPFEAVNGITQTKDGYIYFGDNHIYRLDPDFKAEDMMQTLYPITVTRPNSIDVDGIFPEIGTSVLVDLHSTSKVSKINSTQYIKLKMPVFIVDDIKNITYTDLSQSGIPEKVMPFSLVNLDSKYNEITIPIAFDFSNIRLTINGNNDSVNCDDKSELSDSYFFECHVLEGESLPDQDVEATQEITQDNALIQSENNVSEEDVENNAVS